VLARITVADEVFGPRQQVLLTILDALPERARGGDVDNLYAGTRLDVDVDPVQAGTLVEPSRADGPDLSRGERVPADSALALQLGRSDELLNPILAHHVAEVGIAELGAADPLLLFLDATATFHGQANGPFQVLVAHWLIAVWIEQFEQPVN